MAVNRPYRRTCRQFSDGSYVRDGGLAYVEHPMYAKNPGRYVRGFLLLQKDLRELFDFVEPADSNLECYSYRIHALLMRACVEVEANFRAILRENDYEVQGERFWTMKDYAKIESTHFLSDFRVKVPDWTGELSIRGPFLNWNQGRALSWYQAYNQAKHDRGVRFAYATLEHLIDACCAVLVLLSAQFHTRDFSSGPDLIQFSGRGDGMESGIGDFFRVKFPDIPVEHRYDFDRQVWIEETSKESDPFQNLKFAP